MSGVCKSISHINDCRSHDRQLHQYIYRFGIVMTFTSLSGTAHIYSCALTRMVFHRDSCPHSSGSQAAVTLPDTMMDSIIGTKKSLQRGNMYYLRAFPHISHFTLQHLLRLDCTLPKFAKPVPGISNVPLITMSSVDIYRPVRATKSRPDVSSHVNVDKLTSILNYPRATKQSTPSQ